MAEAKPGNTALEEGIQTLPCDAELEKYFPVIKGNPVVGSRDGSSPCFTPQMIKYYAPNGVLPYKLDVARGEVVFALDNTRFDESMNAQDFRIQCSEIFRLMSPELRRLTADDKRIKLIYFDPNLLDRLTPYIVNPELIDVYRAQRKAEEDAIRGVISDKATEVFVNNLLNRAIQERASDIHFEACGGLEHRIRFRVDGKLRESPNVLSPEMYKSVYCFKESLW